MARKIIFVSFMIYIYCFHLEAKEYNFTLLEKIKKSDYIFLAQNYEITGEQAKYKILSTYKGNTNIDSLTIIIPKLEEKDEFLEFCGNSKLRVTINEKVILFLDKNYIPILEKHGKMFVLPKIEQDLISGLSFLISICAKQEETFIYEIFNNLNNENRFISQSCIRELYNIDVEKYFDKIIENLKPEKKNLSIKMDILNILQKSKNDAIIPIVIDILSDDTDIKVKKKCIEILWPIEDERIAPALLNSFDDDTSADIKSEILFALSRHKYYQKKVPNAIFQKAISIFIKSLYDSNTRIRYAAINSFTWIIYPEAIPLLEKFLDDEDKKIRIEALRAIRFQENKPRNVFSSINDPKKIKYLKSGLILSGIGISIFGIIKYLKK